jgi:hypothetical protein
MPCGKQRNLAGSKGPLATRRGIGADQVAGIAAQGQRKNGRLETKMIRLTLFTDLIEAIGKVAGTLKSAADIPKSEREKYRQTFDETYRLMDTTLNMVIIRLGDILYFNDDFTFLDGVAKLDNFADWHEAERQFRLCQSLRVAVRETETLNGKLTGRISAKHWDTMMQLMGSTLASESDIADQLSVKFQELADAARTATADTPDAAKVREQVKAFRESLIQERRQLIQQEIALHEST